jgi:hypothetical protein
MKAIASRRDFVTRGGVMHARFDLVIRGQNGIVAASSPESDPILVLFDGSVLKLRRDVKAKACDVAARQFAAIIAPEDVDLFGFA